MEVDSEILSSSSNPPPNKYLDCLGQNSVNQEQTFHQNSFITKNELNTIFENTSHFSVSDIKTINLFNHKFDLGTAFQRQSKILFSLALKNLQVFHQNVTNNLTESISNDRVDYYDLRTQITDLLYHAKMYVKDLNNMQSIYNIAYCHKALFEELTRFRLSLNMFSNLPGYVLRHSFSNRGNRCTQASYHLFHGHLEWRWHHLMIMFELNKGHSEINGSIDSNDHTTFEEYLLLFLADLVIIAMEIFDKTQFHDVVDTTPFSCFCVKECWLLLQILVDELHSKSLLKSFWFYIDLLLNKFVGIGPVTPEMNSYAKLNIQHRFKTDDKNGFGIWLLIHIAQLHGFTKNGQFIGSSSDRICSHYKMLELCMKQAVTEDVAEKSLRTYIILVSDITIKWWEPKNDILALLWEYFQKKLNSSFFIQGASIQTLAVCSNTALGYLNKIKQRLSCPHIDTQESSFNNYLYLLGKHFMRCRDNNEVSYWQKFKGRIYPKLSANKLFSLTEMGLINLTSMFLTLAHSIDVNEIGKKLVDILSQVSHEKLDTACKVVIIKTHISLIMLNIENNLDIAYVAKPLLELVNGSFTECNNDNINLVLCVFIEGIGDVFDICQSFYLSEYLLIDVWVSKFLSACNQSSASKLLDIFLKMLVKLYTCYRQIFLIGSSNTDDNIKFRKILDKLLSHVLPFVKQNATNANAIIQTTDAAVYFTLFSLYDETLYMQFDQSFITLFKYFSENEHINIRITRRYLVKLSTHQDAIDHLRVHFTNYESHFVQAWVKCCFLCYDDFKNQEMKDLFSIVHDFEDLKLLYSSSQVSLEDAEDTICALFVATGYGYSTTSKLHIKTQMRELLHNYLGSLESHIIPLIKNPTSLDLTLRVYSVIAVLFLHCSKLLYVRSKPTCLLHILLSQLILPAGLFMDKKPHQYIITAMRKTWFLFIKGLFALNYKTDSYIEKALKDLIVVYVPYFGMQNTNLEKYCTIQPIHKLICSDDCTDLLLDFVYEKLYTNFLIFRGKQVNQHSAMLLAIFCDIITKNNKNIRILRTFVKNLGTSILEHIMFLEDLSPSKKLASNITESIIQSSYLETDEDLKKYFSNSITNLTQKHLAFCSNYIFRLLKKLIDIMPSVVEYTLPDIKNQVACVEARRGVGRDEGLRKSLAELEHHILRTRRILY